MNENPNNSSTNTETLRNLIKESVLKLGPQFSKEQKKEHAKLLVKIFEKGMTPKEALLISDQEISQIYSFAFHEFSAGKYNEALELFKMLLLIEPQQSQFATALGVCYHRLKNYERALQFYILSSILSPNDPVPLFYAYDCLLNLNEKVSAAIMLSNVVARAENKKQYAKIKEQANQLLMHLEKELPNQQDNVAAKSRAHEFGRKE